MACPWVLARVRWILAAAFVAALCGCGRRGAPALPKPVRLEPGVLMYNVSLAGRGDEGRVWIYLPERRSGAKLPCVLVAPAGSRLFHGMPLEMGDRPEHLPYVRAGYAVVAYAIDGPLSDNPTDAEIIGAARAFSKADAGVANARAALDYALAKVPRIDPGRVYTAGHSSAATLALLLAEREPRIKACIAFAPCCNVPQRLGSQAIGPLSQVVPGFREFITDASPHTGMAKLRCPVFLFHADDDGNVPFAEVAGFADALRRTNRNVTFERVPSGGHYDSMIRDGMPRAIRWLSRVPR